MTEKGVQDWLDEYGRAWVKGDPDQAAGLFSEYRLHYWMHG